MAVRKTPKPNISNSTTRISNKKRSPTPRPTIRPFKKLHGNAKTGPIMAPSRRSSGKPNINNKNKAIDVLGSRPLTALDDFPYVPILILHEGNINNSFMEDLKNKARHNVAICTIGPTHIDGADFSMISNMTPIKAIHYMLSKVHIGFMFVARQDKSIVLNEWDQILPSQASNKDGMLFVRRQAWCNNITEFARRLEGLDI